MHRSQSGLLAAKGADYTPNNTTCSRSKTLVPGRARHPSTASYRIRQRADGSLCTEKFLPGARGGALTQKAGERSNRISLGNALAIYTAANELTWQSGTVVEGGTKASFQSDGRLVIATHADVVLWQTDTAGKVDAWPYIQPDGQLMLMNVFPVWARFGFTPGRSHRRKFYPAPWRDIPTHNLNGYQYQVTEW